MSEMLPETQTEVQPKPVEQRRDVVETLVWGAIFIWAGLVYLAYNLGLLNRLQSLKSFGGALAGFHVDVWGFILLGAGLILLISAVVRSTQPAYSRGDNGSLVLAAVLIGVGLSSMFSWHVIWPFILIAIGVGMLLRRK